MTDFTELTSRTGTLVSSAASQARLLVAVTSSGSIAIAADLLEPDVPVIVAADSQVLDHELADVIDAMRRSDTGPPPRLPDSWARRIVAEGVDRWSTADLDEGLLAGDRALALHETGDHDAAADVFHVAAPSLRRFVERQLDLDDDRPPALLGELAALLRVGSAYVPALSDVRDESRRLRRARGAPTSTSAAHGPLDLQPARLDPYSQQHGPEVIVDPLRVPARVLGPALSVERTNDGWTVIFTAAHGLHPEGPATGRLLIRASRREDEEVLAVGPLVFNADSRQFVARLEVDNIDAGNLIVDVYDALAVGPPDYGIAASRDRNHLISAQGAVTLSRDALALVSLRDLVAAATNISLALMLLNDVADTDVAYARYARSLQAAQNHVENWHRRAAAAAARPLLCELAAVLDRSD